MAKNGLPPIHPGAFLREMLEELGVTQADFARAFDQSPQYWLNLQAAYDLKTAEAAMGGRLAGVHSLAHA